MCVSCLECVSQAFHVDSVVLGDLVSDVREKRDSYWSQPTLLPEFDYVDINQSNYICIAVLRVRS